MGKIKILSEEVANRIAAGEVIERPASIVKELVENSIDAGATKITVEIIKGGKNLIKISDNGCGLTEEDALLSFERHATSKIRNVNDIFHIGTLGFRGEALPSIASISHLTMITRTDKEEVATKLEFKAGSLINLTKTSANIGTTITIKKMFQNVPARKKFLKSDQVEYRHILNYLHYQSILYPNIHLKFISNDKEKLNYPIVADVKDRMTTIFGSEFYKKDFIEIKAENRDMKISGFISGLENDSDSLNDFRYLFVNGRYIKDKVIFHGLRTAYEPFIKKMYVFKQGKTPPFIIFLDIAPELVDFNVHPAKLEIRFRDSQLVHYFIKSTITSYLSEYEERKFESIRKKFASPAESEKVTSFETKLYQKRVAPPTTNRDVKKEMDLVYQPDLFQEERYKPIIPETPVEKPKKNIMVTAPEEDLVNPWQIHQSYIMIQVEDGILVIDQHAAHERIIYEKIHDRIEGENPVSQKLLFPLVIDIPPYITSVLTELISDHIELFQKVGFSIKTFSGNSIVIDEIPAELEDWDGGDIFVEILRQLQLEYEETENFKDSIAKSVACKAAIKAGKRMTKKEMLVLINNLFSCKSPYFCPHGRPLMFNITLDELKKRFKRIE